MVQPRCDTALAAEVNPSLTSAAEAATFKEGPTARLKACSTQDQLLRNFKLTHYLPLAFVAAAAAVIAGLLAVSSFFQWLWSQPK